jgi:predicted nicotinamide N-methyase
LSIRPQLWASFQRGLSGESPGRPPYWALEWPGGQALARFLLDHPEIVARRTVIDWGAGSGLVAIAAARAGARLAYAIDRDPQSIKAIRYNARINGAAWKVLPIEAELPSPAVEDGELILAADIWYERFDAMRMTAALRSYAKRGSIVLIADTERAFTPRRSLKILSRYQVPTDQRIEQVALTSAFVAQLEGAAKI